MNPRARHWTAFGILAVCTFFSGASFVTYKASVLAQAPFAAGESSWFISAHNLAPRFVLGTLLLVAVYGASDGGRLIGVVGLIAWLIFQR